MTTHAEKNSSQQRIRGRPFRPGQSGNPNGRPKGIKNHDGLQAVLKMLKDFISTEDNLLKLRNDFQLKFDKNPTKFYSSLIMPLISKTIDIDTPKTEDAIDRLEFILSGRYEQQSKQKKKKNDKQSKS